MAVQYKNYFLPYLIHSHYYEKQSLEENSCLGNSARLGKEKVASPKVWYHTGNLAQDSDFVNKMEVHNINYIIAHHQQEEILPRH